MKHTSYNQQVMYVQQVQKKNSLLFLMQVKWWITINEPAVYSRGYTGTSFAPAIESQGIGDYLAVHTFILAHAKTFHMYNQEFRASQGCKAVLSLIYLFLFREK